MAIVLNDAALRNTIIDAVTSRLNAGSTNSTGQIKIQTSGDVDLSINTLSDPPAGSASSGSVTFSAIANDTILATGTAAKFIAQNKDEATILTGTVTATGGGGDLQFNTISFTIGDTCSISSFTISMPGS